MLCKHCQTEPYNVTKLYYNNANRSAGFDYVSACCWEPLLDEKTGKELSQDEIRNIIRGEEQNHYEP